MDRFSLFRTKICGITQCEGMRLVRRAGGDAIGLNFVPSSPRWVLSKQATVRPEHFSDEEEGWSLATVGVFANQDPKQVASIAREWNLDAIQLHGDETPDDCAVFHSELPELPLIRAFRPAGAGWAQIGTYFDQCERLEVALAAILIDGHVPGQFGGTGVPTDWNRVGQWRREHPSVRLVLAGGLGPENVSRAINVVRPDAVDVASGVEREPGVKDAIATRQFIASAHAAFDRLSEVE